MDPLQLDRAPPWAPAIGAAFYIAALSAGYYYNLTFVQLGLVDLGTRLVGLSHREVSMAMALLAVLTLILAIVTGRHMDRHGWGGDLRTKLRVLCPVLGVQLILTVVAPLIRTPAGYLAWITVCSASLGAAMPVMFSTLADLVPIRHRGRAAAAVAGLAFFVAALYPFEWRIEEFSGVVAAALAPALAAMLLLASGRIRLLDTVVETLGSQTFGPGRYCREPQAATGGAFAALVAVMFAVFFIDSLGFLRIIEAPALMAASWQSPDVGVRLFIGITHVVGAMMAAVLYRNFGRTPLFAWILGLFAFTHLLFTFHLRVGPGSAPPLVLPLFYVLAVSFYTTLNFALWPDHATAGTIGTRTAVGVGVAGWLASFASTALALYSAGAGIPLADHLRYVNALALLLVLGLAVGLYGRRVHVLLRRGVPP